MTRASQPVPSGNILYYGERCGYRCGNVGDEIGPLIVSALSGRAADWSGPIGAHITACGSVAQNLTQAFTGTVWGVGLMFEHLRVETPAADVRAVRGHLTRTRWGSITPLALGDPGLLVGELFPQTRTKRYKVGFVPHYVDANDLDMAGWLRRYYGLGTVIDVCGYPERVLAQMAECEIILSSSLHGLIFADAMGIPNAWMHISEGLAGGSFKFRDYYSLFGIGDPQAMRVTVDTPLSDIMAVADHYERSGIEDIKRDLKAAFPWPKA